MSPKLAEQLFSQIKRIITKPIALCDETGVVFKEYSDLPGRKRFYLRSPITPEKRFVPVEGDETLQAIPIYLEGKLLALMIVKTSPEDIQTIQVITSLAELIVQQFVMQHKPKPDAVDLLLTRVAFRPHSIDQEELSEQLSALGYRLDVQRTAVAVELKGFWDNYLQTLGAPLGEKENLIEAKKHDINQTLTSFFTKNQDNLVGFIGNDVFLILKDLRETDYNRFCQLLGKHYEEISAPLKNVHIKEVTMGVGTPSTSPGGIMRSVQESLQVLRIGKKIVGANQTHRFEGLGVLPLLLMGSEEQKQEYAQNIFTQLDDPQLVQTLEAFLLANLNLTQAAETLKIHRNTVIYRLDRIREKLGKDPREFAEAVELYLASLFGRLFEEASVPAAPIQATPKTSS